MSKRYEFVLSKNRHETFLDRQTGETLEVWDHIAFCETLTQAKNAAGSDVEWEQLVALKKPDYVQDGPWGQMEWLQEYQLVSKDGEWRIWQRNVEAE